MKKFFYVVSILTVILSVSFLSHQYQESVSGTCQRTFWLPAKCTVIIHQAEEVTEKKTKNTTQSFALDKYKELFYDVESTVVIDESFVVHYTTTHGNLVLVATDYLNPPLGAIVKDFDYLGDGKMEFVVERSFGRLLSVAPSVLLCFALGISLVVGVLWIILNL